MKRIPVVSWHKPESFGGFDWYPEIGLASNGFTRERGVWKGISGVDVRLVEIEVEELLEGDALTQEIDSRLDEIEVTLEPLDRFTTQ